jgi:gliding motility-associated-like protein
MRKFLPLFAFFFLFCYSSNATHIRAGEITIRVINLQTSTYEFTLTLYLDQDGVDQPDDGVDQPDAVLNFGDGSPCQKSDGKKQDPVDKIIKSTYKFIHTFSGSGIYTISFNEENRNKNVLNIDNGNSVNIPFYIETQLIIDPFIGVNNSPVLLIPPVDKAAVGQVFLHNPGAYDPDGDSLAFKYAVPKFLTITDAVTKCEYGVASSVPRYQSPADPEFQGKNNINGGPAFYTLDSITGDMEWNTPGTAGNFNVAFIIEEYRKINGKYERIGYVTRDMQIIVSDSKNKPPVIKIPRDTCVIAGSTLNAIISAEDPDNDNLRLDYFGGVFLLQDSKATFTVSGGQPRKGPIEGIFSWNTVCSHVQLQPYQAIFKAQDVLPANPPNLVDLKTWQIKVIAPAPKLLSATTSAGQSIQLEWSPYECGNATKVAIYRREGDLPFTSGFCVTGIPPGYELIAQISNNTTTFLDSNKGKGLKRGVRYCYRIVASFPEPRGGESIASNEVCAELKLEVPVITNVSVTETSKTTGKINVKWTQPIEIDKVAFPPPYEYRLYRAEGITTNINLQLVATKTSITDTSFTDNNLNTVEKAYNYRVLFYSNNNLLDTSEVASSIYVITDEPICSPVLQIDSLKCGEFSSRECNDEQYQNRLTWTPIVGSACSSKSVILNWSFDTPWKNDSFYVYREVNNSTNFQLVAKTKLKTYTDTANIQFGNQYCYYIQSIGKYSNSKLGFLNPIINNSQKLCVDFSEKYLSYNLYYSELNSDTTSMKLLAKNLKESFFVHENIPHFAFCYVLKTVNAAGKETGFSNVVCNDNCPYLELPNVFTPNADGKNDTFDPLRFPNEKCPRFVQSVDFRVVNRWGKPVFTLSSPEGPLRRIQWNGKHDNGQDLATGLYYYEAKIKFITFDPAKAQSTIKGWVQILR